MIKIDIGDLIISKSDHLKYRFNIGFVISKTTKFSLSVPRRANSDEPYELINYKILSDKNGIIHDICLFETDSFNLIKVKK